MVRKDTPRFRTNIDLRIVLFKFRADTSAAIRDEFLTQIKTLKSLSCVKSQRLIVGGPSITEPSEKSKGFQYALVSYHEDRAALAAYQASSEHERYISLNYISNDALLQMQKNEANFLLKGHARVLYSLQGGSGSI